MNRHVGYRSENNSFGSATLQTYTFSKKKKNLHPTKSNNIISFSLNVSRVRSRLYSRLYSQERYQLPVRKSDLIERVEKELQNPEPFSQVASFLYHSSGKLASCIILLGSRLPVSFFQVGSYLYHSSR